MNNPKEEAQRIIADITNCVQKNIVAYNTTNPHYDNVSIVFGDVVEKLSLMYVDGKIDLCKSLYEEIPALPPSEIIEKQTGLKFIRSAIIEHFKSNK